MYPDGIHYREVSLDIPHTTICTARVLDALDAHDAESRLKVSGGNTTVSDVG